MKRKSFTLIELLVVIAIIGLLSSVVLVSLSGAREKARDARRKTDILEIAKALELYYNKYGVYPSETYCDSSIGSCGHVCPCSESDWTYTNYIAKALSDSGFMKNLPLDPINNTTYYYSYEPNCNQGVCAGKGCCNYSLTARLENGSSFTQTNKQTH